MALGMARTRNWGADAQKVALEIILEQRRVAYKVVIEGSGERRREVLMLAASAGGLTLPFIERVADLTHPRHGRWEAHHPFDGRLLATGISHRDVIRATIQAVWH